MYTYVHGGDIYTASGKKNLADYSANINPLGFAAVCKKSNCKIHCRMCGLSGPVLPPLNGKTGRIFSRARGIHFFSATVQQMYCLNWRWP